MNKIQVFISYSKKDAEIAKKIHFDLNRNGIRAWLDSENILPGQQWENVINDAIEESEYLIALLSSNSLSERGYIQKELKRALAKMDELPSSSDIYLIPVRIEECQPLDEKLKNIQCVDIFPSYQDGFNKILRVFNFNDRNKCRKHRKFSVIKIDNNYISYIKPIAEILKRSEKRFKVLDIYINTAQGLKKTNFITLAKTIPQLCPLCRSTEKVIYRTLGEWKCKVCGHTWK